MIKRLTKHGNSYALVIDRGIMDLLDIGADTPLSITTDGRSLIIKPTEDESLRDEFRAAYGKVKKKYDRMLRRLADE